MADDKKLEERPTRPEFLRQVLASNEAALGGMGTNEPDSRLASVPSSSPGGLSSAQRDWSRYSRFTPGGTGR